MIESYNLICTFQGEVLMLGFFTARTQRDEEKTMGIVGRWREVGDLFGSLSLLE